MEDKFKIKLQQTLRSFDVLNRNQHILYRNVADQEFLGLTRYYDSMKHECIRSKVYTKDLEVQLKSVTLKTKSQSKQIQDQRQSKKNAAHKVNRLKQCLKQIYDILNSRQQPSSDQLRHIKNLCEDRLRGSSDFSSNDDDEMDEEEIDSRNCTVDETLDETDNYKQQPKVVQAKKRLSSDDHLNNKRFCYEEPSHRSPTRIIATATFDFTNNLTRPFTVTTNIQHIDSSDTSAGSIITFCENNNHDSRLQLTNKQHSSSNCTTDDNYDLHSVSTSTKTSSTSSIEQTIPVPQHHPMTPLKMYQKQEYFTPLAQNNTVQSIETPPTIKGGTTLPHRFISRKIFKPETCCVCHKRINFGSVAYRCSACCLSCHFDCRENCQLIQCSKSVAADLNTKTPLSSLKYSNRIVNSEPRYKKTPKKTATATHTPVAQRKYFAHI